MILSAQRRRRSLRLYVAIAVVLALAAAVGARQFWKARQRHNEQLAQATPRLEGMPVLGYALTKDRLNYVAYLRWVHVRFPEAGDQYLTECRLRFTLDRPGPPGFRIRGWGKSLFVPESHPASYPRCTLLAVAPESRSDGTALFPEDLPAAVGDFDGRRSGYNDDGTMVWGDVLIDDKAGESLTANVRLEWTGTRAGDLVTDRGAYRLDLEPVANSADLKVFRKGETADPNARVWDKYLALLDELKKPRYRTMTFAEVLTYKPDPSKVTVFLRRDMDLTVYGSLQMAEYEAKAGIRVSYLVNLASTIYSLQARNGRTRISPNALEDLLKLQSLGHEIGWQNDVVAQLIEFNTPPKAWPLHEIRKLRRAGLSMITVAANGSPWCDEHQTYNWDLFSECRLGGPFHLDRPFKNGEHGAVALERKGRQVAFTLPELTMQDLGFQVSANHLAIHLSLRPDQYIYASDVMGDLDWLLAQLRAAPAGSVMQLMTHDNRSTTHSQGLDFTVDPDFAKLYLDELRPTLAP
jgi:hypothetical protein